MGEEIILTLTQKEVNYMKRGLKQVVREHIRSLKKATEYQKSIETKIPAELAAIEKKLNREMI